MMQITVILSGFLALASAQFQDIPGVTPPPWQGPIADHINGIPPKDTPEVTAAKAALNQAYAQVLAVLPELPPEERYKPSPSDVPSQYVPQPQPQPDYRHYLMHYIEPTHAPVPTVKTFAEEVPRSPIGEVPEVHAARLAHLKAVQEAVATLPRLADTNSVHQVPQHHPGLVFQDYLYTQQPAAGQYVVQDTPEVAKAKVEHAAAVAAALG